MNSKSKLFRTIKRFLGRSKIGIIVSLLVLLFLVSNSSIARAYVQRQSAGFVYQENYTPVIAQTIVDLGIGDPNSSTSTAESGFFQLTNLSLTLYSAPPTSGIIWAQDQYRQILGLKSISVSAAGPNDTPTYFPGLGYNILSPILGFWQWTRNIAYGFFVIIMVVIAFMILFRQQLGGQTVITITNSLPSIILSMILVTLSYPLSGFFVDLIYIGSNFVQSVMITAPGSPGHDLAQSQNILNVGNARGSNPDLNFLQPDDPQLSIFSVWWTANSNICKNNTDCNTLTLIPDFGDNPQLNFVGNLAKAIQFGGNFVQNPLIQLILTIAVITVAFKIFSYLINNYILLTTLPIIAPLIFLIAAIPSRTSEIVSEYFKLLLSASLTFIIIYGVFLFMVIVGNSGELSGGFKDAGLVTLTPPLLGYSPAQIASGVAKTLTIYGLYLFTPNIHDYIKNFLNVPIESIFIENVYNRTAAATGVAGNLINTAVERFGPRQNKR